MKHNHKQIKLSVIIVTYNSYKYIENCLVSVLQDAIGIDGKEVFVVDNCSIDYTVELVKTKFPNVIVIENVRNIGFAASNNIAIQKANGKFILLLNPDVVISEGTLSELINFMEDNPEIGVISPKLIRADGSLDYACRRNFPTPLDIYFRLLNIDRLFPNSKFFAHYNLLYLDPSISCEVECVAGAFMLVKRSALSTVGLMDERFFMYFEDIDWAYRFKQSGWKVYYYAKKEVLHYKRGSTSLENDGMLPEFYKALYQGYYKYYGQTMPLFINFIVFYSLKLFLYSSLFFFKSRIIWQGL